MSDIIRMLRVSESDPVQQEAADEIERLRAELAAERQSKGTHHLWERIRILNLARKSAEAERDALRELLREARNHVWQRIPSDTLHARIDAALNKGGTNAD